MARRAGGATRRQRMRDTGYLLHQNVGGRRTLVGVAPSKRGVGEAMSMGTIKSSASDGAAPQMLRRSTWVSGRAARVVDRRAIAIGGVRGIAQI